MVYRDLRFDEQPSNHAVLPSEGAIEQVETLMMTTLPTLSNATIQ